MKSVKNFKLGFIISTIIASLGVIAVVVLCCVFLINPKYTMSKKEFLTKIGDNLNIPLIEINTQKRQEPYDKENYINCSFEISNCENDDYNFQVEMADSYGDDGCVGIRLRGNSTMSLDKKPYRIKFDKKKSLLGLEKNKSWVLLADQLDQSKIRNYTAFTLGQNFEISDYFTPHPNHVALIMNNEFRGIYLLTEQIDENLGRASVNVDENDKKIDIDPNDKEFPFLVEMDSAANKEGVTGVDNFTIEGFSPFEIKYPEFEDRNLKTEEDVVFDYIKEYINAVYETLKTGQSVEVSFRENPVAFEDLVEVDSFVDYYLLNEIMLNMDSGWRSIYMHKTKTGKLVFGPIWDFDRSLTDEFVVPYVRSDIESAKEINLAKKSLLYKYFLQQEKYFDLVAQRYDEIKASILKTAEHLRDYKQVIEKVAVIDAEKWYGETGEFQFGSQYDYVRLYLIDRYTYLDEAFNKSYSEFLQLISYN